MKISDDLPHMHSLELSMLKDEQQFLFDAIDIHIWYLKSPHRYKMANRIHARFFNRTLEDMMDKDINTFLNKEEADITAKLNQQVFTYKEPVVTEEFISGANHEPRLFEISKTPKLDEFGNIEYVLCIAKDITELRKTQEALTLAKLEVERARKLRKTFLSKVSHEIRSPLNSILGFTQLIRNREINETKLPKYLDTIYSNGNQLLQLVDDVIDLAKIESGDISLGIANIQLASVLLEIEQKVRQSELFKAREKNLKIVFPATDVSDVVLKTDAYRFHQLIENTIIASFDLFHKGTIRFDIPQTKGQIKFKIKVQTENLDRHYAKKLLECFSNPDNKAKEDISFGLELSSKILPILQGTMQVDSDLETNFEFTISLPDTIQQANSDEKSTPNSPMGTSIKKAKSKNIIIAEDNPANFFLLKEYLTPYQYNIIQAINGIEVIDFCTRRNDIDLVLMDMKMPVINGFEATRHIKSIRPTLPIIAQTAFSTPEDREQALLAGCDDFLTKPIHIDELLDSVMRFV